MKGVSSIGFGRLRTADDATLSSTSEVRVVCLFNVGSRSVFWSSGFVTGLDSAWRYQAGILRQLLLLDRDFPISWCPAFDIGRERTVAASF